MKANTIFTRLLIAALSGILLAGCASGPAKGPGKPPKAASADPAHSPALLAYYAEEKAEGKIFVVGDSESHIAYLRNQDLPNTVMKVGAGPAGEAVVLQSDPKDSAFEQRLWAEFIKRNLYYAEETQDGQVFVLGSLMSHYNFLREKKLANSEPAEIGGAKLAFEADPANTHLVKRLKTQYAGQHPAPAAP